MTSGWTQLTGIRPHLQDARNGRSPDYPNCAHVRFRPLPNEPTARGALHNYPLDPGTSHSRAMTGRIKVRSRTLTPPRRPP
ncbi:hypothetical protein ElP_74440 (plasmid) [Tautonia plasticadhaerens]|uniref:Uncharacterized protein n=1 Tax=Tautonia plasticadhaerens TaxID=2527974 RepID=A0A518HF53_9BACT|nr:hypothetical protein ElP_74440 [Tautonia plasticadhaerens]